MRKKKLRSSRKRVVLYLRTDTLAVMKKTAAFFHKPVTRYAEECLALHSIRLTRLIKENTTHNS